jgi:hypothetical protein
MKKTKKPSRIAMIAHDRHSMVSQNQDPNSPLDMEIQWLSTLFKDTAMSICLWGKPGKSPFLPVKNHYDHQTGHQFEWLNF